LSNSKLLRQLSLYGDRLLGRLVKHLVASLSRTNPDRASDLCGKTVRRIGPFLPAHRIGRANLSQAYPDKDSDWIEATLRGAWENLGRVAGEYVHLGKLWDYDTEHPNTGRIVTDDEKLFIDLQNDNKPALCFAAHLGNWELPAVMAAAHGLPSAVLYRMPNNKAVAREITRIRAPLMGRLIRSRAQAPLEMAASLERGEHRACWWISISPAASTSTSLVGAAKPIHRSPDSPASSTAPSSAFASLDCRIEGSALPPKVHSHCRVTPPAAST
jgi:KDO2-lipid IV(A) lauroyltransferase